MDWFDIKLLGDIIPQITFGFRNGTISKFGTRSSPKLNFWFRDGTNSEFGEIFLPNPNGCNFSFFNEFWHQFQLPTMWFTATRNIILAVHINLVSSLFDINSIIIFHDTQKFKSYNIFFLLRFKSNFCYNDNGKIFW